MSTTTTVPPRTVIPFRSRVRGGPPAIVAAALIWGTNGLAASFLPAGTSPPTVAAARLLLGGAVLLAMCRIGRLRALTSRPRIVLPLATAAGAMAAYQVSYFAALDLAGVAVGSVVAMAGVPVFAGLIAVLTGRGGISARWLAATALAVTGGVLLALAAPHGRPALGGIACALAAGASYAVFTAASATVIRRGGEPRTTMTVVFLTAGLALTPVLFLAPAGWLLTVQGVPVIAYLAGVSTVGAYLLYGHGLRSTPPTTASTLTLAEPIGAAVIGFLLLREQVTGRGVAGLLVLAVALVMLTLPRRGRPLAPVVRIPQQRSATRPAPSRRTARRPSRRPGPRRKAARRRSRRRRTASS